MNKFLKRIYSLTLIGSISITYLATTQTVYAEKNVPTEKEMQQYMMEQQELKPFIAMDEEGNVEIIPLHEVDTPDMEELKALEEVEYNVVAEVDGTEVVVDTQDTKAQAQAVVLEVESIGESLKSIPTATAGEVEEIAEKIEKLELKGLDEVVEQVKGHAESKQVKETKSSETSTVGVMERIIDPFMPLTVRAASVEEKDIAQIDNVVIAETIKDVTDGIVIIPGYLEFKHATTGVTGYTHGSYGSDAAYLGMEDGKVKFKQAGVIGLADVNKVSVVKYDEFIKNNPVINRYKTVNGRLYHEITTNNKSVASTQIVGYLPEFMQNDTRYYSYDGNYFYTDYKTMVNDYIVGNYNHAINKSEPYYNYYQYLSQRSKTGFTATQIDQYLNSKISDSRSKLLNTGDAFIKNQNTYGVNAILMLGVAINESAWGLSSIAQSKNNLFGHGAIDGNPYYGANGYNLPEDSIKYHAEIFMSKGSANGFIDPWSWKYFGPHLGNKQTGVNVKYASDPYWGEKAAAHGYLIEDYYNDATYDYQKESIGVYSGKVISYKEPGQTEIYNSITGAGTVENNFPVIILDKVVSGGKTWYKIQSDGVLRSDRSGLDKSTGEYNFTTNYVYIDASVVHVVNEVEDIPKPPTIEPPTTEPTDPPKEEYVKGDVNGDGAVLASDYMLIKNHVLGRVKLTGDHLERADVNGDGDILASDYMLIKNHVLGRVLLK